MKNKSIRQICLAISKLDNYDDVNLFFNELFTKSELEDFAQRWRILKMLSEGNTQREIARDLRVSLCKVTRGAKILKNQSSIIKKLFRKD